MAAKKAKRKIVLDPAKLKAAEHSADQAKTIISTGELISRLPEHPTEIKTPKLNDEPSRESALSIVGGVTTDQLRAALAVQTEQRKLIKQFIQENLEEGTDYGRIHVVKRCPAEERQPGSCDREYHYSKSILMKPGQEKIFSLFSITDEIKKDTEAYEMLSGVDGLIAYKCLMWRGDKRIGEGRGAAVLGNERSDPNSAIKKAEKRARMDACLSLGFSAYFTQDLDDPDYKAQREMMNSKAAAEAERRDKDDLGLWMRDPSEVIDNNERAKLFNMIKSAGYKERTAIISLLEANGISDPSSMKSGQAREFMRKLRDGLYIPVALRSEPEVLDIIADVPDGPLEELPDLPPEEISKPDIKEAELVVDDDFKSNVTEMIEELGLNARGSMWFKQYVIGKPFGRTEDYSDADWRKSFYAAQDILDMKLPVKDEYIMGFVENVDTPDMQD